MGSRSNEGQFMLALQARIQDPDLSIRAAAKIYGVSRKTLKRRSDHTQSRQDITPNSRKLTDLEESTIIQYILDPDEQSFPPRLRDVEDMTNRLLADRDTPPVGPRWASNFAKRHKELSTRFTRRYDYQRALCENPNLICGWFQLVRNTVAKYGIQNEDMYNFDETGFMMGMISTTMVATSSERCGKQILAQLGNRECVTEIQGIDSQGWARLANK